MVTILIFGWINGLLVELFLCPNTQMDMTILVGEELTLEISQFKVTMILKILELSP